MSCHWPGCNKSTMPGKVYCRNHTHGNENNESHSYRHGKTTGKDEGLSGHKQGDTGRGTGSSEILRKQSPKGRR